MSSDADLPLAKKARSPGLCNIKSKSQFIEQCPGISLSEAAYTPVVKLSRRATRALVRAVATPIVDCMRTVQIDNEASRYPFIYEMLKIFVAMTDNTLKCNEVSSVDRSEIDEEDVVEVVEDFIRTSDTGPEPEPPLDLIMRWERYYSEMIATRTTGFVEFVLESRVSKFTRWLIECKVNLMEREGSDEYNGFYQACAELVLARDHNVVKACTDASDAAVTAYSLTAEYAGHVAKFEAARTAQLTKRKKKAGEMSRLKSECASAKQHIETGIAAAKDASAKSVRTGEYGKPVYAALTDLSQWVFLRLTGNIIEKSPLMKLFQLDTVAGEISSSPAMARGLEYMCDAASVDVQDLEFIERLTQLTTASQSCAETLYNDVCGADKAVYAVCKLVRDFKADATDVDIMDFVAKVYPDYSWNDLVEMQSEGDAEKL